MKKKRWLKLLIGILSILVIINIVASFYFYNLAIERNTKDFLQGNDDLEVSAEAMEVFTEGDWHDWVEKQDFKRWEISSFDNLELNGYFLPAKEPTNKTVILAHGYLGSGLDMGLYGQYYYEELGYNILMPDARGHGESEGDYIGFGWHDRLDYVKWINLVKENLGNNSEIVLHGVSMGAATVLMTSGEDLPDNVKAIVADSAYTSVEDLFAYQMKRMYHLPKFPFLTSTSFVTDIKAGYNFDEASALKQVKKTDIPILYYHGNADTFVPTEMAYELAENTASPSEIMTIDDAGHGEGFVVEKEAYVQKLNEFLGKYVE
ncbi:alpha/beta hydrolase [Virgibacillus necropolis]|uniref:alpha/beta hydrolase n=1 Tax=Virgibacillus necropolis TaxID=163877 RepID=UPI001D04478A|nr:alpha/beta hydrolase [Virgibacillus necropolis]